MSTSYLYGSSNLNTNAGNTTIVFSGGDLYGGTDYGTEIVLPGGSTAQTVMDDGATLALWSGAVLDNSPEFAGSGNLLQIYGTTMPSDTIYDFTYGNKIDLASVPYSSAGTVSFNSSNDVLAITENSITYDLQLDSTGVGLTFALVPDGSGGTDIVEAVSVATFLGNESYYNTITGGVAISDTAANVYSNLAALNLDASHIALIQATGGQVTVGNGLFVADEAALNLIVGGFTIDGQASVLSGNLNGLEADISHINSITGLNGTITATAAEFLPDLTALNKVVGGYDVDVPNGYEVDVTINGATNISSASLILSGTAGLIFDGTTVQNISMTTQEYNDFTTITDGSGTTAANSTVTFTNGGTVTTNSSVGNYILAATGGDAITIGASGTVELGSHTSADTITFGTATSTAEVTGWNYANDILHVSAIGTGVAAASPVDLVYNPSTSGLGNTLSMGHVDFMTDSTNAGNEVAFYTNVANYGSAAGELNTGATAANAILIVNDGTHSLNDVFYVVGNGAHAATSVALIGTYDMTSNHYTATLLA